MDMTGEYRIGAPRETVWAALNDPEVLRQCIPGCEELEKLSDTEYAAKVVAKVGPVKAKFAGKVALSDLDPPNGYTISGEGSGGAAGFGKGGARVRLAEDGPATTVLAYEAHATVGGKLAQIGSRLVDATARKMADDFFARFTEVVGRPAAVVADVPPPDPVPEPVPGAEPVPAAMPPHRDEDAAVAAAEPVPAAAAPMTAPGSTTQTGGGPAPQTSGGPAPQTSGGPATRPGQGLRPAVWIGALIVLVVVLLLFFN